MATEAGRWAIYGALIGIVMFGIIYGYIFITAPHYSDDQKLELNKGYAVNCTKCLEKNNSTCTADTIQYTQWGVLCNTTWVKDCNTICKKVK